MRIKGFSAAIGAGTVLALATTIQAAEARHTTSSRAQITIAQYGPAIRAAFKAEAAFKKARAQAAKALKAEGWYFEGKYYRP